MEGSILLSVAGLFGLGIAAALTALAAMAMVSRCTAPAAGHNTALIAFLFEDGQLADASDGAHAALAGAPTRGTDLERVSAWLAPRFPDLSDRLAAAGDIALALTEVDGPARLRVDRHGSTLRLSLTAAPPDFNFDPDAPALRAMADELDLLRPLADLPHVPVWRQSGDGRILWANGAYLDLTDRVEPGGEATAWPPHPLFDAAALAEIEAHGTRRLRLDTVRDGARWFDCHTVPVGADLLVAAVPADAVIAAETEKRAVVQTMTKTFARLSTRLAIFDRQRRLSVFNPALTDLLPIPVEFLSARPSLTSFLDQLRERRLMPEPKDYRAWRDAMLALEEAAGGDGYCETWSLPDGQIYRVIGQPHPSGALGLIFEDISDEIALTRRFRAELDTCQSVLDGFDEAVAVFSAGGTLTLSNRAYARLWSADPATGFSDLTLTEATRRWRALCFPNPVWGDLRDYATTLTERSPWTAEVTMRTGKRLACRFEPLPGGATLVGFGGNVSVPRLPPPRAADLAATG